ncbi:MAG: FtsX-like permease family protein [Flavobacteriales bacterium TMED84]|nr:MAG: FtsX-like permease family protein [Flavobacteriales bacterium TMED84]
MLLENIKIAYDSLKKNFLRSFLTVTIISIGMMAIMGIITAIESIETSIESNFITMGSNTFKIKDKNQKNLASVSGKSKKKVEKINYRQALKITEKYQKAASVSSTLSRTFKIRRNNLETNPNVTLVGTDKNYVLTSGYFIERGRNFSENEIQTGSNVVLIGSSVKERLFDESYEIDQKVSIAGTKFKVIGSLKEKGTSFGFNADNIILMPIDIGRKFIANRMNYEINIISKNTDSLDYIIGQVTADFRKIRKLRPIENNNFKIVKSDNLAARLIQNIQFITFSTTLIGLMTLFGASIGLMNIMLVSVSERTREIGLRKSLGANSRIIRNQFLTESILICQIGGAIGILMGIAIGNVVSVLIEGAFVFPTLWTLVSVLLCFVVGIMSGIYPAVKASKLSPVEALRYN